MARKRSTAKTKPTTSRDGVVYSVVTTAERRHLPPAPGSIDRATERATRRIAAIAPLREAYLELLRPRLGRAAFRELEELTLKAAEWAQLHFDPEKGPLRPWTLAALARAYRHLVETHGLKALQREWVDQQVRDAAATNDEGVLRLWDHVQAKLRRLMNANRSQWFIPGTPAGEFIENARLEVLAALRSGELARHEHAGREAIVDFVVRFRNRERKRRTIAEVLLPTDVIRPREEALIRQDTEAEARLYARERERLLGKLPEHLTRIQRRWLTAMRADVTWNDDLNLARVAQQLERNRSSASRAAEEIASVLRELFGISEDECP
ncbi:MAG TPA: hypothetical protein VE057_26035 [Archangium sp.]|nr:hypothetical protein [Archangium sp.]